MPQARPKGHASSTPSHNITWVVASIDSMHGNLAEIPHTRKVCAKCRDCSLDDPDKRQASFNRCVNRIILQDTCTGVDECR